MDEHGALPWGRGEPRVVLTGCEAPEWLAGALHSARLPTHIFMILVINYASASFHAMYVPPKTELYK